MANSAAIETLPRTRARLSRTASLSRWDEYGRLLDAARSLEYRILSLEQFLAADAEDAEPTLILRHDVDQCPGAALRMLEIERRRGLHATWFFRWRTARPRVIRAVLEAGGEIGLHYETLSRMALEIGGEAQVTPELLMRGRRELRREVIAFDVLFGPTLSACAHGDTHAPHVSNLWLLEDQSLPDYRLRYDANLSMRTRPLGVWLTDRSAADGGWRDGLDPLEVLSSGTSPVLLLTHPNNWVSGPHLWMDRVKRRLMPNPSLDALRATRSGSDSPPLR